MITYNEKMVEVALDKIKWLALSPEWCISECTNELPRSEAPGVSTAEVPRA